MQLTSPLIVALSLGVAVATADARKPKPPIPLPYGLYFGMSKVAGNRALRRHGNKSPVTGWEACRLHGVQWETGIGRFKGGRLYEIYLSYEATASKKRQVLARYYRLKRTLKKLTGKRGRRDAKAAHKSYVWKHRGVQVAVSHAITFGGGEDNHIVSMTFTPLPGYQRSTGAAAAATATNAIPACDRFIGQMQCILRKFPPSARRTAGPGIRKSIRDIRTGVAAARTRKQRRAAARECRKGSARLRRDLWKYRQYRSCLR